MFHGSNLGSFAPTEHLDMNGFLPDEDDGPWDLTYDHGSERTHDEDGLLTDYGIWWELERFPELKAAALGAVRSASRALAEWIATS